MQNLPRFGFLGKMLKKKKKGKQPSSRAKKILFGDFIAGPEPGLAPPQDWLERATVLTTCSCDEATSSHPTPPLLPVSLTSQEGDGLKEFCQLLVNGGLGI